MLSQKIYTRTWNKGYQNLKQELPELETRVTRIWNKRYQNLKQELPEPETRGTRTKNKSDTKTKIIGVPLWMPLNYDWQIFTLGWQIFTSGWQIFTSQLESDMYLPYFNPLIISTLRHLCHICHFFSPKHFFAMKSKNEGKQQKASLFFKSKALCCPRRIRTTTIFPLRRKNKKPHSF